MLFKIIDGKPYYFKDGAVYQTSIDGGSVTVGEKESIEQTDGVYTIHEIRAKCSVLSSITEKKVKSK